MIHGVAIFVFNLQVMLPDTLKGRYWHTTNIVQRDPTHKRMIHFGGMDEESGNTGDGATWHPVAETTIVELGEWSGPHSHCCYGIHLIHFGHLTVQCDSVVVSTLSVDFSTRKCQHHCTLVVMYTRKCQHHCTLVVMYTMVYMESYQ